MTSQAALGAAAGTPYSIEHGGRAFRVGKLTRKAMNAFSVWLIQQTREQVVAIYGRDPEALKAELDSLKREALAGVFQFTEELVMGRQVTKRERRVIDGLEVDGEVTRREGGALKTPGGMAALLGILCGCDEDQAQDLFLAKPEEVAHLLELTLAESFPTQAAPKDDWTPLPPEGEAKNSPGRP